MGRFIIKNAELRAAANDYAKACSDYAIKMNKLKTFLENVTDEWKDEVADEWARLVPETSEDLKKINKNLEYNRKLLAEIADKADALQAKIKSEINKLYLT